MDPILEFKKECSARVESYSKDEEFSSLSLAWLKEGFDKQYTYNFTWLGRPIIQHPVDMVAIQELAWKVQPDLIIETGIAHGGSLILSASMMQLLDSCFPGKKERKVLGIDIDIRSHNLEAIKAHPLSKRVEMIQGSSIGEDVIAKVKDFAKDYEKIMVILDSNHTHSHVLEELSAYAPLVSKDSYCVVFDTIVEFLPDECSAGRPWKKGNSPFSAVTEYLKKNENFVVDKAMDSKLMLSYAKSGFLKRVK